MMWCPLQTIPRMQLLVLLSAEIVIEAINQSGISPCVFVFCVTNKQIFRWLWGNLKYDDDDESKCSKAQKM
jgi:hypothetical protein